MTFLFSEFLPADTAGTAVNRPPLRVTPGPHTTASNTYASRLMGL